MRRLALLVPFFAACAIAAPAAHASGGVQTITVVNDAQVSTAILARVERAVVDQARWLRRYWRTPLIAFGPGGWVLTIEPSVDGVCISDELGCHADTSSGAVAFVADEPGWSVMFSHEAMETLADPSGAGYEVCDPAEGVPYKLDGVPVADFMLPSWFAKRRRERLDWLGVMLPNGWVNGNRNPRPRR